MYDKTAFAFCSVWKSITLNSSSDQSKYRVWDYPIKEQYGHILQAITQTGPVENATVGFQKVLLEVSFSISKLKISSNIC
jgi:hypothetical protein